MMRTRALDYPTTWHQLKMSLIIIRVLDDLLDPGALYASF